PATADDRHRVDRTAPGRGPPRRRTGQDERGAGDVRGVAADAARLPDPGGRAARGAAGLPAHVPVPVGGGGTGGDVGRGRGRRLISACRTGTGSPASAAPAARRRRRPRRTRSRRSPRTPPRSA